MATRYMTRKEIIDDLSKAFCEQNCIAELDNDDLAGAWISHGTHAGTEDFDDVCVDQLYYNNESGNLDMLSTFRDYSDPDEDVFGLQSREDFDAWAEAHLTPIEHFADEYDLNEIIENFSGSGVAGKYLVVELDSEDTPEFPYIPAAVWDKIEVYDDLFSEIQNGQEMTLAAALVQLKLLRGHAITEIAHTGHGFSGWDGMIIEVA